MTEMAPKEIGINDDEAVEPGVYRLTFADGNTTITVVVVVHDPTTEGNLYEFAATQAKEDLENIWTYGMPPVYEALK